MIISLVLGVVVLFLTSKYREKWPKGLVKCVRVLAVMGVIVSVGLFFQSQSFDGRIEKRSLGEGSRTESIVGESNGEKVSIDYDVPTRALSRKEAHSLFRKAKKEIDDTVLGENESRDHVEGSLVFSESYVDGKVRADWDVDDEVVGVDGSVHNVGLKEKKLINVTAHLSCGEIEEDYVFCVVIPKFDSKSKDSMRKAMESAVRSSEKQKNTERYVYLPDKLYGQKVKWSVKSENKGLYIILISVIMLVFYPLIQREKELREGRKRDACMTEDYPYIVEKLSLYISAGMSVRKAFPLIKDGYEKRLEKRNERRYGFELIQRCASFLENGASESECFERFGNEAKHRDYKRLALILLQNLKGGNCELRTILSKEALEAESKEKQLMKMRGEMISTKLIVPLMGMLFVVMLILIVPGIWGISI